jgi:chromosome segregation ATPase
MTTDDQIAAMKSRIEELEDQVGDLREQVLRAQIEQWQGRIDDLEVQVHLGSMEVDERVAPLVQGLRDRWLDAQEKLTNAPETTGDVLNALRDGLEKAMGDIRDAVLDVKRTVTS